MALVPFVQVGKNDFGKGGCIKDWFYCDSFIMENNASYDLFVDRRMLKETRYCCEKNYLMKKQLSVVEIDDGVILPGKSELGGIYDYDKSDLAIENTEVVYLGMMISVWGHCLTDNLKHLWFIFDEKYGHLKHLKWVYTMLSGDGFQSDDNFCALLSHLGVDLFNCNKITKIDKPTKFRKIYIPDDCFIKDNDNHYYTNEFKVIIDDLINDVRNSCTNFIGADKVYFTRTLKEGTRMIIIRKAYYCNGYQLAINQMKKLNVVLIDCHLSVFANPLGPWSGPFYLYVNRHLMDYFNCKRKIRREGFANYLSKNWFLFLKRYVKKMLKSWKE